VLELGDEDLEAELAVLDAGRVGERAPVVEANPVVVCLRQLGLEVAQAVNGAVLAIGARPNLLGR
jgi:hypothetical protein